MGSVILQVLVRLYRNYFMVYLRNKPLKLIRTRRLIMCHYTIPFGFSLIWHFFVITFQLFILHVWLRITDEGSEPEMRIWSISLI